MPIKNITNDDEPNIIKDYISGVGLEKLQSKYRTSIGMIKRILNKNDIYLRNRSESCKRFFANENYFEKIDTEEKSYFLGLLYADGCIPTGRNNFELGLSGDDELGILEKLKNACNYTGPILIHKKIKDSHKTAYRLSINSKKMVEDLIKLGCVPRKSLILKFPTEDQVPKNLINHFIRGYFDGDGTINFRKNNTLNIGALCSKFFYEDFNKLVFIHLGFELGFYPYKNSIDIKIGGIVKPYKFCTWIYKDATIFLKRKKDKFDQFVEHYSEKLKAGGWCWNLRKIQRDEIEECFGVKTDISFLNLDQRLILDDLMVKNTPIRAMSRIIKVSNTAIYTYLKSIGKSEYRRAKSRKSI